jgi:hypothetical protein
MSNTTNFKYPTTLPGDSYNGTPLVFRTLEPKEELVDVRRINFYVMYLITGGNNIKRAPNAMSDPRGGIVGRGEPRPYITDTRPPPEMIIKG